MVSVNMRAGRLRRAAVPVAGRPPALAWIPVLLGAHQFIEALAWLWLQGHVPRGIGHVALWAYLLIAFAVLPVFARLAVIAVEPTRRRKLTSWTGAPADGARARLSPPAPTRARRGNRQVRTGVDTVRSAPVPG
jgi:hypothetical protein